MLQVSSRLAVRNCVLCKDPVGHRNIPANADRRHGARGIWAPRSRQADPAPAILKPGVGPNRIEGRPQQDGGVESRLIGLEYFCSLHPHMTGKIIVKPGAEPSK
jgi:hypothetical protein